MADAVLAVAALFVSAVSLWVAIRTENANEQLVAASTWPFLQVQVDNATPEGKAYLKFNVVNGGVGPAKVESFEVFLKGKPYRSGRDLLTACCGLKSEGGPILPDQDHHTRLLTGTVQGLVLRAGESEAFVMLPLAQDNTPVWNALNQAQLHDITYRICYCSVLDQCWRNALSSNLGDPRQLHPEEVKTCPVPAVPYAR
ncbi:MAG: hypothetical protein ACREHE_06795 [Rhizomicrobium sp.]